MRKETETWLNYSVENLEAAKVLLDSQLYNPCLQNIQQSVEKGLKSIFIENGIKLKKTHSISELNYQLISENIEIDITEDESELLDSIYLPSKYPIGSVLPDYEPDESICREAIEFTERILESIKDTLKS